MSQYVILIQTPSIEIYHGLDHRSAIFYALTTTNHPPTGLLNLQNFCPVKLEAIHFINSRNQTDILLKALQIKFQHRLLHSFWYAFSPEDITFIKALNEHNFSNMIGFIQRGLKKPDMNQDQLQAFIQEQLQKAEGAL